MERSVGTGAPMAPVVDNKQKGGSGLKIITAIACVVAVCGIGFGIYGMMQCPQKDNHCPAVTKDEGASNNEDHVEDFLTADEYKAYLEKYIYLDKVLLNIFDDGLTEDAKLLITNYEFHRESDTFTYDSINSVYTKLFEGNLPKEDIKNKSYCMEIYRLNKETMIYTDSHEVVGCGGYDSTIYYYAINDTEATNDGFKIYVRYGTAERKDKSNDDYTLWDIRYVIETDKETKEFECGGDISGCDEEAIKKYLQENENYLDLYTFTFIHRNEGYVLRSISKVDATDGEG